MSSHSQIKFCLKTPQRLAEEKNGGGKEREKDHKELSINPRRTAKISAAKSSFWVI